MPEFNLQATSPLNGYQHNFGTVVVEELPDLNSVVLAKPVGGEQPLAEVVQKKWGIALPEPNQSILSDDGRFRLLWMAPDQVLLMFTGPEMEPEAMIKENLDADIYVTDQTHNLVVLNLSGVDAVAALERICPLDLDHNVFKPGQIKRTVMEHLGVHILRNNLTSFTLISASSSAQSFLHAVVTSVQNIIH